MTFSRRTLLNTISGKHIQNFKYPRKRSISQYVGKIPKIQDEENRSLT
jgi:hypothetical protein